MARRLPIYIHDRDDWPLFSWDAAALASDLARVRHRQGRLVGRMESLGFSSRSEAVLHALTDDAVDTSGIEGVSLDKGQVRSSLARRLGLDVGAVAPVDRDVEGVVEMTLDATQDYASLLTEARLFRWHTSLFPTEQSGVSHIAVGAWRRDVTGPMQVVSGPLGRERVHFEAPAAARLDSEMAAFLDWFNRPPGVDPVLRAGLAHLWFVTIHPFDDGNGRIARAIADMALAGSEGSSQRFYSMSAQIRLERKVYYATLERTQKGDLDVTDWLRWFLACLDRAFDRAEQVLELVLRRARFWEAHAGSPPNARQRAMIDRLFEGFVGKLTSSKWAKLAKCSPDTALRDIADLVRRGVLVRRPGAGRSTSYALAETWSKPSPPRVASARPRAH